MRLASLAFVLALFLACGAKQAEAQVVDDSAVLATIAGVGTVGGIATSVAAVVYAVDNRAFDDAWVVGSLFSSAICGSMTVAFAVEGFSTGGAEIGLALLFYAALTVWPAYWTIRTSLSEVDPGDKLDGEYLPEEPVDPFASSRASNLGVTAFTFGGSF